MCNYRIPRLGSTKKEQPLHDITQFFVIEFVPSAVLSLTNYLKQKSIPH